MQPPRQDLLASFHPVTRTLRRIEDDAAATHGITMWQYAILSVVSGSDDLNQRQVASVLQYSPNRLIADVDDLEHRGLLVRTPGEDRRANVLRATKAGVKLQRRVQADIHEQEDLLLAHLAPARRRQLADAVQQLAQRIRS
jgi:DNA-binding MarR family transcriptional regulator